ncbi:hypothetical protein [Sphingopyxis sp. H115]|uniref:hypothetical protein n=1 Tax=Sphingopyxis sp. H115 TaxID=1759073 RepID=UPI0007366FEC|nr:hypothetical protein [Sphingopyxis sp. H115]KTE08220.1 hypothetical protein ATE71_14535 [Sphingopyxis sp. H115]
MRFKSLFSRAATQKTPVSETSPTSGYPWTGFPSRTSIIRAQDARERGSVYTKTRLMASKPLGVPFNANFTALRAL